MASLEQRGGQFHLGLPRAVLLGGFRNQGSDVGQLQRCIEAKQRAPLGDAFIDLIEEGSPSTLSTPTGQSP